MGQIRIYPVLDVRNFMLGITRKEKRREDEEGQDSPRLSKITCGLHRG